MGQIITNLSIYLNFSELEQCLCVIKKCLSGAANYVFSDFPNFIVLSLFSLLFSVHRMNIELEKNLNIVYSLSKSLSHNFILIINKSLIIMLMDYGAPKMISNLPLEHF